MMSMDKDSLGSPSWRGAGAVFLAVLLLVLAVTQSSLSQPGARVSLLNVKLRELAQVAKSQQDTLSAEDEIIREAKAHADNIIHTPISQTNDEAALSDKELLKIAISEQEHDSAKSKGDTHDEKETDMNSSTLNRLAREAEAGQRQDNDLSDYERNEDSNQYHSAEDEDHGKIPMGVLKLAKHAAEEMEKEGDIPRPIEKHSDSEAVESEDENHGVVKPDILNLAKQAKAEQEYGLLKGKKRVEEEKILAEATQEEKAKEQSEAKKQQDAQSELMKQAVEEQQHDMLKKAKEVHTYMVKSGSGKESVKSWSGEGAERGGEDAGTDTAEESADQQAGLKDDLVALLKQAQAEQKEDVIAPASKPIVQKVDKLDHVSEKVQADARAEESADSEVVESTLGADNGASGGDGS